jgi:hypothetical protein
VGQLASPARGHPRRAGHYACSSRFDDALAQRAVKPEHRAQLVTATEPEELLEKMLAWKPLVVAKWMTEEET